MYSIFFADQNNGWAAGESGIILHTSNGGTNWSPQLSGTPLLLHCINFVNSNTGWITGFSGKILATTNGGAEWNNQISGVNVFIRSCDFISSSTGWVAGDNGTILSTTNSGTDWNLQTSQTTSNFYSTCFVNSSLGWAVGENGTIRSTVTGGRTFKNLQLRILIEGFYDEFFDTMISDSAIVYLRRETFPYTLIDSAAGVVNSDGTGSFNFLNPADGVNYYLIVKHRNSLETWSSSAQTFISDSLTFDFSNSSSQAFGNNLKLKGSRWAVYSGDTDNNGFIDLNDLLFVYNYASEFQSGYLLSDINGDYDTDLSDVLIVYNNALNFIHLISP